MNCPYSVLLDSLPAIGSISLSVCAHLFNDARLCVCVNVVCARLYAWIKQKGVGAALAAKS